MLIDTDGDWLNQLVVDYGIDYTFRQHGILRFQLRVLEFTSAGRTLIIALFL